MKQLKSITMYNTHKKTASDRGISFLLSFNEWNNWWLSHGIDKNGPSQKELGISRKDTLCMCRYGDIGPYSLDNIYCATASQNAKDMDKYKHKFSRKPIKTKEGNFQSIKEWCEFTGKSRYYWSKIRKDVLNVN
jgi:hypothetical protein